VDVATGLPPSVARLSERIYSGERASIKIRGQGQGLALLPDGQKTIGALSRRRLFARLLVLAIAAAAGNAHHALENARATGLDMMESEDWEQGQSDRRKTQ
jgi:hypothetical protein